MNRNQEIKGSIFEFLSAVFVSYHIQCLLVGGYAMIAHKVQRMTFDVDFLLSEDDYNKIEADLLKVGYKVINRQSSFVQLQDQNSRLRDLDFLLSDGNTIKILHATAKEISIAGATFFIPSAINLIAMKMHSIIGNPHREVKDLPDIIQLMLMYSIDADSPEMQKIFVRHGSPELYQKIISAIRRDFGTRR